MVGIIDFMANLLAIAFLSLFIIVLLSASAYFIAIVVIAIRDMFKGDL